MKSTTMLPLLLIFVLTASFIKGFANDDKFKAAMLKNIKAVYTADSISEYQQAANALERISQAEPTRWEPLYYTAFAYILMSGKEKDKVKRDAYLDQAMAAISKANGIAHDESELVALEGFAYMMRIPIDPASRGMMYAPKAMQAFEKAAALNPNNPRAVALKAQMEFGTAQFFGSGTEASCASNAKALAMFAADVPKNELSPVWGKEMAEGLSQKCK
jgi:tetratricopeptide (TPR) repeat protein